MPKKAEIAKKGVLKGNPGRKKREEQEKKPSFSRIHNIHEQNVGRNMGDKGHCDEISDGNEEHITRQWWKGNPCYKVAKDLAEFWSCSSVL